MVNVICDMASLNQERPEVLAECLAGISPIRPFVQHKSRPHVSDLVASFGVQNTRSLREWGFPSIVDSIECRYIERWLHVDDTDHTLKLRHTYFHLYHHEDPDQSPREILAFHWEPLGSDDDDGGRELLWRPHLHLAFAPQPLGRSHVVVTLTVAPHEQADLEYLDELLREVMNMVRIEILNRINANPRGWG